MKAQKRKRPRPGDILQVTVDDHAAYLHYVGTHPMYGDTIRVLGGSAVPEAPEQLEVWLASGYVTFYPVGAAARHGLVTVIAHESGSLVMPSKLRRACVRADGKVLSWFIQENGAERLTKQLTADERTLPIAAIWNHEMLCIRLREGWRPERDGLANRETAEEPVDETSNAAAAEKEAVVLHYIYFPEKRAAKVAARYLAANGFDTESRLGADGVNWLVLARHTVVPTEEVMDRSMAMLEELASSAGGEYDGWETG